MLFLITWSSDRHVKSEFYWTSVTRQHCGSSDDWHTFRIQLLGSMSDSKIAFWSKRNQQNFEQVEKAVIQFNPA